MKPICTPKSTPRALVVVPGGVNYFYDQVGSRIGEALRNLGIDTSVHPLESVPDVQFDLCVFVNVYEVAVGFGGEEEGLRRIEKLPKKIPASFAVAMDC